MLSQEMYVKQELPHCPYCGSDALDWDSMEVCGTEVLQEVTCHECGHEWFDRYELTGFSERL